MRRLLPHAIVTIAFAAGMATACSANASSGPQGDGGPTCPKCGNVGARTEYRPCGQTMRWGADITSFGSERLHRECRRCDYAWDEATVEAKEAT